VTGNIFISIMLCARVWFIPQLQTQVKFSRIHIVTKALLFIFLCSVYPDILFVNLILLKIRCNLFSFISVITVYS